MCVTRRMVPASLTPAPVEIPSRSSRNPSRQRKSRHRHCRRATARHHRTALISSFSRVMFALFLVKLVAYVRGRRVDVCHTVLCAWQILLCRALGVVASTPVLTGFTTTTRSYFGQVRTHGQPGWRLGTSMAPRRHASPRTGAAARLGSRRGARRSQDGHSCTPRGSF